MTETTREIQTTPTTPPTAKAPRERGGAHRAPHPATSEPVLEASWYKDAVIYQLHVRSFYDSDGDGIGDFIGLTERLDYLEQLGVTAIWLLPFYPSPLRDDGYDIAHYRQVNPMYGDLDEFRRFLDEAHRRGLRVITELVINHTSDQHPWFQRARHATPDHPHRDYYVWSDTPEKYEETRIIFKDFESSNWSWDPVAQSYYWHRFYHHQPDLNFDNPEVLREVLEVLDFWLGMGVDGLRLDAIPYLVEREGTNCENLPETHEVLKKIRTHVDRHHEDKMLLAEANQWPEDAVAYFGDDDECHMSFHFPLMPRLFMGLRMEDRFPVIDILEQTPEIPPGCQWAVFLRNHDELTLEMVTDEDRDYMYRVYAADPRARINLGIRRRLAPLLGNDRRRVELMTALLLSLPGTPVLYYGDEIGMGDNIYLGDRNGVRTPMQWSPDRNAGFSHANPQRLFLPVVMDPEYHFEAVNVEAQESNPHSLLWWTRRLIALRKRHPAFGRGEIEFLHPDNHKVLAFVRRLGEERILVVVNLSRFVQHVELDLAEFEGVVAREMFGHTEFPRIGELPYLLTLGPHGFYWFDLSGHSDLEEREEGALPTLTVATDDWTSCLDGDAQGDLERALPQLLATRRWFGGKSRTIREVEITGHLPLTGSDGTLAACIALVTVQYVEEEPETYTLPLAHATGERAERLFVERPGAALARTAPPGGETDGEAGLLYDALFEPEIASLLLEAIAGERRIDAGSLRLEARRGGAFAELAGDDPDALAPRVSRAEQSNTSVVFGDRLILKLFRRLEPGLNPDLEIGRFLTDQTDFDHLPPVAGSLELVRGRGEAPWTVGILQGYVENEGDAWAHALDVLGRFFERVLAVPADRRAELEASERWNRAQAHPLELARRLRDDGEPDHRAADRLAEPGPATGPAGGDRPTDADAELGEVLGFFPASARLLGQRTAELHLALASDSQDESFRPEPFNELYRRSLYQAMRSATGRTFRQLEKKVRDLPEETAARVERLLAQRDALLDRFGELVETPMEAQRIRVHGDFHLGQALSTGKDFQIIDFEGEPARPLSERRIKRSPLRDVAGMLRSFDYAAHSALYTELRRGVRTEELPALERWARFWQSEVAAAFLAGYRDTLGGSSLVPREEQPLRLLLDAYLLDKAIYELRYELDNRPDWLEIPLAGILELLGQEGV